uniref:Uncharacterized protein n=1 Tax=feces metagenome TaxID=1861841 RepID=A0A7M2QLZ0_9ZZZZ
MKFNVSTCGTLVELVVDVLGTTLCFRHSIPQAQYERDPKAAVLWAKTYLANSAGATLTQKIKEAI